MKCKCKEHMIPLEKLKKKYAHGGIYHLDPPDKFAKYRKEPVMFSTPKDAIDSIMGNVFVNGKLFQVAPGPITEVTDVFINGKRVADKGKIYWSNTQNTVPLQGILDMQSFAELFGTPIGHRHVFPREPVIMKKVYKIGGFTIVALRKRVGNKAVEAIGIAIRSPKDDDNRERGIMIAEGRAMKALDLKWRGRAIVNRFMG